MSHEPISRRTYTLVFFLLMVLLALSVWVAQFDLGDWNLTVAITISVAKTILILLFFMHILYASRLTQLVAVGGLLWLGIAAILTFSDYLTRGWQSDALPKYHETTVDRSGPQRPSKEHLRDR